MAFRCRLWERECNGCQHCLENDIFIDAVCFDLAGEFLDFNMTDMKRFQGGENE